ncbi:MAG: acyl-CoA thioesterase [Saprospiraceae bacterium]|nr:acyl-CoA thioesterase [Saprospiraceae bacterium]
MYTATTQVRVRYGETDQMGYLYYGFYAWYYEVGRVEAIRELGIEYKKMEEEGIILPVVQLTSKYIRPAKYDDLLVVKTTIPALPKAGLIQFECEIEDEEGTLLNIGKVSLVFVDKATRKKTTPPAYFIEKLRPYFETAPA